MNNKYFFGGVACLAVGLVLGFFLFRPAQKFGAITPSNALDQQALVDELTRISGPLVSMVSYSSSSFTLPVATLGGSATSSISSSTAGASALAGIVPGDFVLVTLSSSSLGVKGINVNGYVVASDTILLSFPQSPSGTLPTGLVGLGIRVLTNASFTAPTGL